MDRGLGNGHQRTSAWILCGTTMGDGSVLDTDSFLLKGEHVPAHARWRGNPATEVLATTAPQVRAPASAEISGESPALAPSLGPDARSSKSPDNPRRPRSQAGLGDYGPEDLETTAPKKGQRVGSSAAKPLK